MTRLDGIDHFVVLMLENRSFDSLFGRLYSGRSDFNGLNGTESNPWGTNGTFSVWNGGAPSETCLPDPDPGELFDDINQQIFGGQTPQGTATMSGFALNYAKNAGDPRNIMHYFRPEQIPALSALAKSYAVCDEWYASAPCQTWPNRFFVHTGTANGYSNNSPTHFPYLMPTIFGELDGKVPFDWKIYYHDIPHSLVLSRLWYRLDHFKLFEDFLEDARTGQLPSYAFIEPRYFSDVDWPNDMHPPHNVGYGDELVATIYNALLGSVAWPKTLLVVLFDEHGGCFDHVAPPAAVPPSRPEPGQAFAFDRYGVRVPAVVVSPLISPGTVFRSGGHPFDHTSIIKTLRQRFSIVAPLSARDAGAPELGQVLDLDAPSDVGRQSVMALSLAPDPAGLLRARAQPMNDLQGALHEAAAYLAPLAQGLDVDQHIQNLANNKIPDIPPARSPAEAASLVKGVMERLRSVGLGAR